MRFIKPIGNYRDYIKLRRLRIAKLNSKDKKKYLIHRILDTFTFILVVLIIGSVGFTQVLPGYNDLWIGYKIVIVVIYIIGTLFLSGYLVFLRFKIYPNNLHLIDLPIVTKEMIHKVNRKKFSRYKIQGSYRVTKCYDCTNSWFKNQDVMLYFYRGNLRITNNLNRTLKDIGCYEISYDEIEYHYDKMEHLTTTEIRTDKVSFSLGRLAKPFIQRGFEEGKNE